MSIVIWVFIKRGEEDAQIHSKVLKSVFVDIYSSNPSAAR